jgi:hypothetical protein
MLTDIESEILLTAMKFVKMEAGLVLETSSGVLKKEDKILSWHDLYTKNSFISEELHEDWIEKNKEPALLNSLSEEKKYQFIPLEKFDSFFQLPEKVWSTFFTITRPGISSDGQTAIVQVTARCPSGPPNYASLLFLEKSVHFWDVKSTHSLYNQ